MWAKRTLGVPDGNGCTRAKTAVSLYDGIHHLDIMARSGSDTITGLGNNDGSRKPLNTRRDRTNWLGRNTIHINMPLLKRFR
jgi:hypothetical protein